MQATTARSNAERVNVDRIARNTFKRVVAMLEKMPADSSFAILVADLEEELRRRVDTKSYVRCHSCDGAGALRAKGAVNVIDCARCEATGYMPHTHLQHLQPQPPRAN